MLYLGMMHVQPGRAQSTGINIPYGKPLTNVGWSRWVKGSPFLQKRLFTHKVLRGISKSFSVSFKGLSSHVP